MGKEKKIGMDDGLLISNILCNFTSTSLIRFFSDTVQSSYY